MEKIDNSQNINNGIFIGRFNPMHIGHERVCKKMIQMCDNYIIIIGSSNSKNNMRNIFSYSERRMFIKTIFPDIKIVGLPDYSSIKEWLQALDDIIDLVNFTKNNTIFFGGALKDISFFKNRRTYIIDRFNNNYGKISATKVRDYLNQNKSLEGLVNNRIQLLVKKIFDEKILQYQWD